MGGVSGLSTLLSGAYIGLAPGEGEPARSFVRPRGAAADQLERARPRVRADRVDLGSVSRALPSPTAASTSARCWVTSSPRTRGRSTSRSSSRSPTTAGALREPLLERERHRHPRRRRRLRRARRLAPGAADRRHRVRHAAGRRASEVAAAGATFPLFASEHAVAQAQYTEKIPYLVYFDGSVRGLSPGAPVEFRGLRVGSVTGVRLEFDPTNNRIRIPVTLEIEPQRLVAYDPRAPDRDREPPHHDRAGPPRPARPAPDRQPAHRRADRRPHLRPERRTGGARHQRAGAGDPSVPEHAGPAPGLGDRDPEQGRGPAGRGAGGEPDQDRARGWRASSPRPACRRRPVARIRRWRAAGDHRPGRREFRAGAGQPQDRGRSRLGHPAAGADHARLGAAHRSGRPRR